MSKKTLTFLAVFIILGSTIPTQAFRVYLKKDNIATNPYVYAWTDKGELFGTWGQTSLQGTTKVTLGGEDFFYKEIGEYASVNIIFKQDWQTSDINNVTSETFYQLNGKNNGGQYNVLTLSKPTLASPKITRNGDTVTITTSDDSGDVYYTLDGSDPTTSSTKGDVALDLSEKTTIKAVQIYENMTSEVVTLEFEHHTYAQSEGEAVYFATDSDDTVSICATDEVYFPVERDNESVANQPEALYLLGNLKDSDGQYHSWVTNYEVKAKRYGKVFVFEDVTFENKGYTDAYFNLSTKIGGTTWDTVNSSDRYGAPSKDVAIDTDNFVTVTRFHDNPGSANSWKIPAGTYRIVVDFSAGYDNVKLMYTQKAAPEFVAMPLTSVEKDRVGVDGKKLYRTALEGNLNVAFLQGSEFITGGQVEDGATYIHNGQWSETMRVEAILQDVENNVFTGEQTLKLTYGATGGKYSIGDIDVELTDSDNEIITEDIEAHGLFTIRWQATNTEGLTYYGSYTLINRPTDANDVVIYAKVPENWDGIAFNMVSDLCNDHILTGVMEEQEDKYLTLTVPAHMVHSTITFSNVSATSYPENAPRRQANENGTFTYRLAGQSMYFDNNGKHWANTAYVRTGIDTIASDSVTPTFFTLQGIPVAKPAGGIYIMRQGDTVTKVYIK